MWFWPVQKTYCQSRTLSSPLNSYHSLQPSDLRHVWEINLHMLTNDFCTAADVPRWMGHHDKVCRAFIQQHWAHVNRILPVIPVTWLWFYTSIWHVVVCHAKYLTLIKHILLTKPDMAASKGKYWADTISACMILRNWHQHLRKLMKCISRLQCMLLPCRTNSKQDLLVHTLWSTSKVLLWHARSWVRPIYQC